MIFPSEPLHSASLYEPSGAKSITALSSQAMALSAWVSNHQFRVYEKESGRGSSEAWSLASPHDEDQVPASQCSSTFRQQTAKTAYPKIFPHLRFDLSGKLIHNYLQLIISCRKPTSFIKISMIISRTLM